MWKLWRSEISETQGPKKWELPQQKKILPDIKDEKIEMRYTMKKITKKNDYLPTESHCDREIKESPGKYGTNWKKTWKLLRSEIRKRNIGPEKNEKNHRKKIKLPDT